MLNRGPCLVRRARGAQSARRERQITHPLVEKACTMKAFSPDAGYWIGVVRYAKLSPEGTRRHKTVSRPTDASAQQILDPMEQELLDAFFKAKDAVMEQLGVRTDAELCDALERKFPDLFPKLH